ncbi:hypothetical protein SSPO_002480 [Streptomyces antimycoticus]|uniref:Radical SAM core domain-containing protein n=1 Tax=Streptomyces antimycoticus TaxID=68175 RepID=A0A499UCU1_9ACTN|nr:radical SAM protein [Streptomyces antimycoticus]BBJ37530.1 hypothetical protein SSPO_002480 [Streptomyces antimycoticus]
MFTVSEEQSVKVELPWQRKSLPLAVIDAKEHFTRPVGPIEHEDADECPIDIKNIGWTLGNDCPYRCTHCYSMSAREKGMDFTLEIVDRIVEQLAINNVETVNLGATSRSLPTGRTPGTPCCRGSSTA